MAFFNNQTVNDYKREILDSAARESFGRKRQDRVDLGAGGKGVGNGGFEDVRGRAGRLVGAYIGYQSHIVLEDIARSFHSENLKRAVEQFSRGEKLFPLISFLKEGKTYELTKANV